MIESIGAWVKNLIFLVLFAAFFELLLPSRGMKSFLRVIVGLFLMLAVLQPVTAFMTEQPVWRDLPAFGASRSPSGAPPRVDAAAQKRLLEAVYCEELARRLRAELENMPEVSAARVKIRLKASEQPVKDAAGIEAITVQIRLKSAGGDEKIVVSVAKKIQRQALPAEIEKKIKQQAGTLYQVPVDKITVSLWE